MMIYLFIFPAESSQVKALEERSPSLSRSLVLSFSLSPCVLFCLSLSLPHSLVLSCSHCLPVYYSVSLCPSLTLLFSLVLSVSLCIILSLSFPPSL